MHLEDWTPYCFIIRDLLYEGSWEAMEKDADVKPFLTGMGLDRTIATLQGAESVYDTAKLSPQSRASEHPSSSELLTLSIAVGDGSPHRANGLSSRWRAPPDTARRCRARTQPRR